MKCLNLTIIIICLMAGAVDLRGQVADPAPPAVPTNPTTDKLAAFKKQTETWTAASLEFDQAKQQAPTLLEQIRAELAQPTTDAGLSYPTDASLSVLEQLQAQAVANLDAVKRKAADWDAEFARRTERRAEIPKLTIAAKERLGKINDALAVPPPADEAADVTEARKTLQNAEKAALEAELESYVKEVASYDARSELIVARRDMAAKRVAVAERIVQAWQDVVTKQRKDEADGAARQAKAAKLAATRLHPVLKELADRNSALAELRTGTSGLAAKIRQTEEAVKVIAGKRDDLDRRATQLSNRMKVQSAASSHALALVLRRHRAEIPDGHEHQRAIRNRQAEIGDAQLAILELYEERGELSRLDVKVAEYVGGVDFHTMQVTREEFESLLRDSLTTQRNYMDAAVADYERYTQLLLELDSSEQALIARIEAFESLIAEFILWLKSHETADLSLPVTAKDSFIQLDWPGTSKRVIGTLQTYAVPSVLVVLVSVVIAMLSVKFRPIAESLNARVRSIHTDSNLLTMRMLLLCMFRASAVPVLLLGIGGVLSWDRLAADDDGIVQAIGTALIQVGLCLYVLNLIRHVCCPQGLGTVHFRWDEEAVRSVARGLPWWMLVLLPVVFTMMISESLVGIDPRQPIGRVTFVIGCGCVFVLVSRLLRPNGAVMQAWLPPGESPRMLRSIFRFMIPTVVELVPFTLAGFSLVGYHYSSIRAAGWIMETVTLLLLAVLAHAVLTRSVMVARRRAALEESKRLRAKMAAEAISTEGDSSLRTPPTVADAALDLVTMTEQSRKLINAITIVAVCAGLWVTWVEVIPAMNMLNRIELWDDYVQVSERVESPDGSVSTQVHEQKRPITLAHLALSVIAVVVTVVVARHLPGLLELAVLQQLSVAQGERYAITTIVRYALTVVGVIISFNAIGIGWSKVQWLIAAISLGLGFGLQEIFANFVSGLILLFERPIRVGDIVTVGSVSGTVSRIQIRATTIVDWNRKELVIPNKAFVTDQLTNWTLSESILRVDIPVGVAYGSDMAQVRRILREIAVDTPYVLSDPENRRPKVRFMAFADSSLNFELRVYIPHPDYILDVRDSIADRLTLAFEAAGITIPFPQRDVHIIPAEPEADPPKPIPIPDDPAI